MLLLWPFLVIGSLSALPFTAIARPSTFSPPGSILDLLDLCPSQSTISNPLQTTLHRYRPRLIAETSNLRHLASRRSRQFERAKASSKLHSLPVFILWGLFSVSTIGSHAAPCNLAQLARRRTRPDEELFRLLPALHLPLLYSSISAMALFVLPRHWQPGHSFIIAFSRSPSLPLNLLDSLLFFFFFFFFADNENP